MNLKNELNQDQAKTDQLETSDQTDTIKLSYQSPVLTEYGDVTSIIEAGGTGSLDVFQGPTFI